MNISELFVATISELARRKLKFVLAGGIVANLYRSEIRATADIDIMLLSDGNEQKAALAVLSSLNMKGTPVREGNLRAGPMMGKKVSPVWLVVGGRKTDSVSVDFILPSIPWFMKAFKRAENNVLTLMGVDVPCLRVEDVIISKCFSYDVGTRRHKDLDDIEAILRDSLEIINMDYLSATLDELELPLPQSVMKGAPKALRSLSRRLRGRKRAGV